jgi:hypothetical protein
LGQRYLGRDLGLSRSALSGSAAGSLARQTGDERLQGLVNVAQGILRFPVAPAVKGFQFHEALLEGIEIP